jgi:hypothetical protein
MTTAPPPRQPPRAQHPREVGRAVAGLATALVAHAVLLVFIRGAEPRRLFDAPPATAPIALEIVTRVEEQAPDTPSTRRPPSREPSPAPRPPQDDALAPPIEPPPAPASEAAAAAPPSPAVPTTEGPSLMRQPRDDGAIGRALGTDGPLSPSVAGLEGALDLKVDGPMSDAARAGLTAERNLLADMADDAVSVGLADDYFRALRNRVETNWRPAMKELNDGGASVTQVGMMKSFFEERSAWDEMWRAYRDLGQQYARGQQPVLEPARKERLRELMRSRKGMFRLHAISEVVLTQSPDGKIVTLEMPLPSGHPGIDEGVKDAIATAIDAMPDPPPARVHHGRPFQSTWRLRATWSMVPPTALLTGSGFDITPKGIDVDIPFEIKLKTNVLLLRTSTPVGVSAADDP